MMGIIFNIWLTQLGIGIVLGAFAGVAATMVKIIKFDKEWEIEHNKLMERIRIK